LHGIIKTGGDSYMNENQSNTTHQIETIELTAAELGHLFISYISNTMSKCVLTYFVHTTNDTDIKSIAETSLEITNDVIDKIKQIYMSINHPIPKGFNDEDINLKANKLFSDTFVLNYLRFNQQYALIYYCSGLVESARDDARTFFSYCVDVTRELYNKVQDILLAKGLFIRPPTIPVPDQIGYVHKQSYLSGFFGDKRPINAIEIANLYSAIETNLIGNIVSLAFAQVVKDERIKKQCVKGSVISKKQIEMFSKLLEKDYLNAPTSWNITISSSTESPFSDKLITFHMSSLSAFGLGRYGLSASQCTRKDITLSFIEGGAETALYAKEWLNIMLDNNWLERIPEAADREELRGV
jgi:hypothetical protein